MRTIFRHMTAWARRGRLDDDLREELEQHVAWKTQRLVADGVPEAEARRRARVEVGNLTRLREDSRSIWGFPSIDSIAQDARYALRQMRRAPGFTAVAVLSLAIGIGASAAVFSLADAMLFRKMPVVTDPDTLVLVSWASGPVFPFSSLNGNGNQNADGLSSTSFALVAYREMQSAAKDSTDLLGFADLYDVNVAVEGRAEMANAHAISANYFDVLGVPPAAGRALGAADNRPDAAPAAMISDAFWQRRFAGSPDAVGRPIVVNGIPFTIAGVTPRGFRGTGQVVDAPDVFVPLAQRGRVVRSEEPDDDPNYWWVLVMGRLRPGAAAPGVQSALDVALKRTVASAKPQLTAKDLPRIRVLPGARGQQEQRDSMRDPLRTMAIVVTIVLLVACANVANLLLARGRARVRELSVRAAIGAPRSRVVRQLFTEGAVLAVCGAALGAVAARWITAALMPALTQQPDAAPVGLDWRLLAFIIALAGGSAILFALAPALRSTRTTLTSGLQEAARRGTPGPRRGRLAGVLVVVQIALSMVLVVTATLLVRSLRNLDRAELGFDPHNVLTFRLDPTLNGYKDDRVRGLYASVLDALRASPGVVAATSTGHTLLSNASSIRVATTEGEAVPDPGSAPARAFMAEHQVWSQATGTGFFDAIRLPILRGRALDDRDTATSQRVAVVNVLFAKHLFKTDDVVGRRFRLGMRTSSPLYEIVGVSGNARYTAVREDMPPTVYLAAAQQPPGPATFEVRVAGSAEAFAATARDIVRRIDDQLPLAGVRTVEDQIARSLEQERLFARLAMLLGAVTLALSAIGLYGLLAYGVAQRVPEIGLRMALGAERASVRWMVLRQSLVLAGAGLIAGGGAAIAALKLVASMLYQLPPRDPATVAIAAVIMLATCLLAGYLPARRASRVDPLVALRAE
jgi:predicted permease